MSKHNTFETDLLAAILNATPIANLLDNAATSPFTNLYISLHVGDPGESGNQTTSECDYTGYARVAIARNNGAPAWTISSPGGVGTAQNSGTVTFGLCTAGTDSVTYAAVGTASSGTGKLLYKGALSATLEVSNGITPSFAAIQITVTED